MSDATRARPKLLFVLSADHGELFNAMYFLAGTDADASLALPPRLFELNEGALPHRLHRYESVADIVAAVDAERPDVVLLFSGYLLVVNRIFDLEALDELLAALRARGLRVVTTDPSVGVMSRIDEGTFDPRSAGREWLLWHGPRIFERLRDLVHVYLAPDVATEVPHVSFFNPAIAADAEGRRRCRERLLAWPPIARDRERWLFVVSQEDFELQGATRGRRRFSELLSAHLADAARAGRQPVLVAPPACFDALDAAGPRAPGLVGLALCDYPHFMRLLYEAECVFYWNLFSASIVARVLSRLPFFLLDRGHLAFVLRPFFEAAAAHFYRGSDIGILAPETRLTALGLAPLVRELPAKLYDPVHANLSRAPTPDEVLAEWIR